MEYIYRELTRPAFVASFERSGIVLQVDPYTVTVPYEPREEQEHIEDAAGVEVV